MFNLLQQGGWVMYVILGCSVIAMMLVLERLIYFAWTRERYKFFLKRIKQHISQKDIKGAIAFAREKHSCLSRLTVVYLRNLKRNPEVLSDILHREGSQEMERAEQRLPGLAVIGHLTPLLGLLGTVLGMITCFKQIQAMGGQADVNVLAGGIWAALLTTAFGLTVAIPVNAAYHYFENQANKRANQLQYLISELNQIFNIHTIDKNLKELKEAEFKNAEYETVS